jgi:DNA-binding transcriptional regulator YiaG
MAQKPRIKESLPKELKRWRRAQRLSQSKAAALRLKVSVKTLQNWEQGQRAPAGFALEQLREKIR